MVPESVIDMYINNYAIIVPIIAALIASVAALIAAYFNWKQNRKLRYINTITASRIQWIDKIRSDIAEFCSKCWQLSVGYNHMSKEESIELKANIDRLKAVINLQLNPKEELSKRIIDRLDEIFGLIHNIDFNSFLSNIQYLVEESQVLLKIEWEKAKKEANKGRLSKRAQKKLESGLAILDTPAPKISLRRSSSE